MKKILNKIKSLFRSKDEKALIKSKEWMKERMGSDNVEDIKILKRILEWVKDESQHTQVLVVYDDIASVEGFMNQFPGTQFYGKQLRWYKRLEHYYNNHPCEDLQFAHCFSFSVVDPVCKEVYLDELKYLGKYYNSKSLPNGVVSFVYLRADTYMDICQNWRELHVILHEYKEIIIHI